MSAREEFESTYKKESTSNQHSSKFFRFEDGFYSIWEVEVAWRCYQAGLEAAAKVCDDAEEGARKADTGEQFHEGSIMACGFCSTGIRKLKDGG